MEVTKHLRCRSRSEDDRYYTRSTASEKSVEVKAAAVAKAKATREVRHSMGKRQRKKVRG